MLNKFDEAFTIFEKDVYSKIHEFHFDPAKELNNFKIQIRAQSLSGDIGYCAMIIRDYHAAAIQETSNRLDKHSLLDEKVSQTIPLINEKFVSSFKSFMFFVRSYYDVIYNIGVASIDDKEEKRGHKESLYKAIQEQNKQPSKQNKILKILNSEIPEFTEWFLKMRELRNAIKYGVGVAHQSEKNFATGEVKVSFQIKLRENSDPLILNLDDITDILNTTTKVTHAILKMKK